MSSAVGRKHLQSVMATGHGLTTPPCGTFSLNSMELGPTDFITQLNVDDIVLPELNQPDDFANSSMYFWDPNKLGFGVESVKAESAFNPISPGLNPFAEAIKLAEADTSPFRDPPRASLSWTEPTRTSTDYASTFRQSPRSMNVTGKPWRLSAAVTGINSPGTTMSSPPKSPLPPRRNVRRELTLRTTRSSARAARNEGKAVPEPVAPKKSEPAPKANNNRLKWNPEPEEIDMDESPNSDILQEEGIPEFSKVKVSVGVRKVRGKDGIESRYVCEGRLYIGPTTKNRPAYKSKQSWEWDIYPHGVSKHHGKLRIQVKRRGCNPAYPFFPNTLEGVLYAGLFRDIEILRLWNSGVLVRPPRLNFRHDAKTLNVGKDTPKKRSSRSKESSRSERASQRRKTTKQGNQWARPAKCSHYVGRCPREREMMPCMACHVEQQRNQRSG